MKKKAEELLKAAQAEAVNVTTWADLSNFLFDPEDGIVTKAFPNRADREVFIKTPEYKAIRQLINDIQKRTGLVKGATPKKSGKFVVRLPRSLHAALEAEAEREGVSLNQLVVAKLSMQMSQMITGGTT